MVTTMWAVVGSALAARRGQAIVVALVALLASAALAAAPWYAVAATQQVGVAAVAGTPVDERLITVSLGLATHDPTPPDPVGELRRQFQPAGFTSIGGGDATGSLTRADGASTEINLAYREEVCGHLVITGACPTAPGELVVSAATAAELGLATGDQLEVVQFEDERAEVRVVGVYQFVDPSDPYWGDGQLVGQGARATAEHEAAFTVEATLPDYRRVTYTHELVAIPEAFAEADPEALWVGLEPALAELRRQQYAVTTSQLEGVVQRIIDDRRNVATGVGVGLAVLLLFGWFTLVVLLRNAVVQLRGDVGWWRLHGVPPGRGWIVALGQSIVPLVGGVVLGATAGVGIGQLLGGDIVGDAGRRTALQLGLVLVGITVAGGLVAVVATQLGTLRTSVSDLIRRVPPRRRRWRRSLVDVVLVTLAAAAVGQALTADDRSGGLAMLAPPMAVLGLALVVGWAVPPLVAWLAARALRAGRLAVALVAASMARRPGIHRLFALVAVAVALLTTGLVGWDTAARTQWQRAALETGAHRVVTMATVDSERLLAAVRAVDPTGTEAMAVLRRPATGGQPAMLAVDSARLPVVVGWRDEYGGNVDEVMAALRPAAPEPLLVTTERLVVVAAGRDPAGTAVWLRVLLRTLTTGEPVEAVLGPLADRPDRFSMDTPACAAGCRLVGFELLGPPTEAGYSRPSEGTRVEVSELAGADSTLLAEPTRWRPAVGRQQLGPTIAAATGGGLRLTMPPVPELPGDRALRPDGWVFAVDAPAPLPVLAAGWRPRSTEELRLAPLTGLPVPAEVVGTAALVPLLGESGLVTDLEYAQRLMPFPNPGTTPEVWLSANARPSIMDDLRAAGLRPLREESLSRQLDRLGAEGSSVAVRFQATVALVGLLLAAGAVLVLATQERTGWAAELAALRAQGVAAAVVRVVSYGGLAAVIAAAVTTGLGAGLVGAAIARLLHPGFVDGWQVLPIAPLRPYPVAGVLVVTTAVLGGVVLAAAVALVRRTRERLS
jgi:putative ABC transport system permease protein